jgi:hypothetical protein
MTFSNQFFSSFFSIIILQVIWIKSFFQEEHKNPKTKLLTKQEKFYSVSKVYGVFNQFFENIDIL